MTKEEAIRFLDHQAKRCRDRDAHEALCLLLPALMAIFRLDPMDDDEAEESRYRLKRLLIVLDRDLRPAQRPGPSPARIMQVPAHESEAYLAGACRKG